MDEGLNSNQPAAHQGYLSIENAEIFWRDIGQGQPIIVIHGGPDFDHTYLLPDMDRLSDSYRLIYYDQRGRGGSRGELRLEEISIEQTIADLEGLQDHLGLATVAILGHSWGGHVAMHYAIRRPD